MFAYTVVATDEDDNGIFILDDVTVSGTAGSGSIVHLGGSIVGKTSAVPASLAHDDQGAGALRRRRRQSRDAHQRGDGDGGRGGDDADDLGGGGHLHAAA